MGADVDWTVTPRPIYHADGRKEPDCYTDPPELHDELTDAARHVPAVHLLGPGRRASPRRRWICRGRRSRSWPTTHPDLTLVYVPHLDYDLQRFGPSAPQAAAAAAELDAVLGPLLDAAAARGRDGGGAVRVRHHRRRPGRSTSTGCCAPRACCGCYTQAGMEYLDPWTSRAFAVADHQVAHVYVRDPADVPAVAKLCAGAARRGRGARRRPARPRTAWTTRAPASWCWSPSRTPGSPTTTGSTTRAAPDFARLVEIHRKPGYDPAELFFDPAGAGRGEAPGGGGAGCARSSACAT